MYWDLDVPYDELEDYKAPSGASLKNVKYDIEMTPAGATVEFAVRFEGEKLGSEYASIDFQ